MKLKQKAAYALAIMLGLTSIFGGIGVPLFDGGLSEVQAVASTAPIAATFEPNGLIVEGFVQEYNNKEQYFEPYISVDGIYPVIKDRNNESYTYSEMKYEFNNLKKMELVFVKDDDKTIKKSIIVTGLDNIKSSDKDALITISSNDFTFKNNTYSIPVKIRKTKLTGITITEGKSYTTIVGTDEDNNLYVTEAAFKPSTSGKYTFSGTGGKDIAVYIWEEDDDDDRTIASIKAGNASKTATVSLKAGKEYYIFIHLDPWSDGNDNRESLTFSISKATDSTTKSSGNTTSTTTSYYYSSSDDDDDDDDKSSSSSSYDKGDSRTAGKGSTKADYVKTGTDTVRYDASDISDKAKSAKVPATVKIKGKVYKVTAISSKAFDGKKNLKDLTIGINVKRIGEGAFNGCTKLKNLTVKTTGLTKKGVKGSLKGSSVRKISAPASKVGAYTNIFKKSNAKGKTSPNVKANK